MPETEVQAVGGVTPALDGWFTVPEAGQALLLTYRQVLERIKAGRIEARLHGRQYLIAAEEVRRYDDERRANFRVGTWRGGATSVREL